MAIDYFTKWVESELLASITDKQVQSFIWKNIITRFKIPKTLISNNGRQFNSEPTREYCSKFDILRFPDCRRRARQRLQIR